MTDSPAGFSDAVVFRVAQLFLTERLSTSKIADQVNREFQGGKPLTRESIYPVLADAVSRGFLRLVPPVNKQLADRLAAKYPGLPPGCLHVVETGGPKDNAKVAAHAATLALEIIKELAKLGGQHMVGVGLGPGRATRDFCEELGNILKRFPEPLKLKLVAISAGCPADAPEYASISFFNLFPHQMVEQKVGLFAETLVRVGEFERLKNQPGVREAFEARESIDLVVTSMGDVSDSHDLLSMFLVKAGVNPSRLRSARWVGNVQYRPYSKEGPIKEKQDDLRAVTVFELEDLVRFASKKFKHVILIARQCGLCQRARAEALRPLLTNPSLRAFSTLVMDGATALALLKDP